MLPYRSDVWDLEVHMIQYGRLVSAPESPSLNPCVRKMGKTLLAEQQHAADCRHLMALVSSHQP